MENLKVKANNISERNEIQELFIALGYKFVNNIACENGFVVASQSSSGVNFDYWADVKEITLQYLRDLVILKRNCVDDATHYRSDGKEYFHAKSTDYFYHFQDDAWVLSTWMNYQLLPQLKPIKEKEMKEFLVNHDNKWTLQSLDSDTEENSYRVAVPSGADLFAVARGNRLFYAKTGELVTPYKFIYEGDFRWSKTATNPYEVSGFVDRILWQRKHTTTTNTPIQDKLKFIEKWLNGEKIQYILGVESDKIQSEKTQWHNFTEGAMQYIKRSDIKFREAPKYVTINSIEFKSVESLLKHVKNNFDLEDGE